MLSASSMLAFGLVCNAKKIFLRGLRGTPDWEPLQLTGCNVGDTKLCRGNQNYTGGGGAYELLAHGMKSLLYGNPCVLLYLTVFNTWWCRVAGVWTMMVWGLQALTYAAVAD